MIEMRIVAALAGGALCACSMTFVDRAPRRPIPGDPIECTSSQTWPVVDVLLGSATLLSGELQAAGVLKGTETADDGTSRSVELSSRQRVAAGIGGALYAALFAYSAYWGFHAVAHCRAVQATNPPQPYEVPGPIPQSGPPGGVP